MPAPFPLLRCYRITRRPYEALDGEGARRVGGRWNSPGRPAIYAAEEPSLTVLETLVHLDLTPELIPDDYVILEIELPALEAADIEELRAPLPDDAGCRKIGDDFLQRGRALALRVPSIIVPLSSNFVINPAHGAMSGVKTIASHPFSWDSRLLKP